MQSKRPPVTRLSFICLKCSNDESVSDVALLCNVSDFVGKFSAEDQDKMETQEIEIGRIKSPAIFYFTSKKWWSTFEVDFQQMQGYFEQRPPKVCNPSTLRSNDRVLVRNFCQRNIWRRAQICKVDLKRRSCKVLLIDTGEVEEDIDLAELYHLSRTPIDWAFFPPQGAKKLAVVGVKSMELDEWPISILTTTHLLKEKATKIWAHLETNGGSRQKNSYSGDIIFQIPPNATEIVFENWSKHPKGGIISMRKLLIYEGFGDDGQDEGFVTAEEDSDNDEISLDIFAQSSHNSVSANHKCMETYDVGRKEGGHYLVDNFGQVPDPNVNFSTKPKKINEGRKEAKKRLLAELSDQEESIEPFGYQGFSTNFRTGKKDDPGIDPVGQLLPPLKESVQTMNQHSFEFGQSFSLKCQDDEIPSSCKGETWLQTDNESIGPNDLRNLINSRRKLQQGLGFKELCKSKQAKQTDPKKNENPEANSSRSCLGARPKNQRNYLNDIKISNRKLDEYAQNIEESSKPELSEDKRVPYPRVSKIEEQEDGDDATVSDEGSSGPAILEYDQDTMPALAIVKDCSPLLTTKRPTQVMWKDNETHLLLDISFRDCDLKQDLIKTFLHLCVEQQVFSMEYMDNLFSVVCLKFQLSECVVPCQTNVSFRGLNLKISLKKLVPKACHAPSPFIEEGQYVKKHWIIHDPMDFECSDADGEENDLLHNQSLLPWETSQSNSITQKPIEGCLSWNESRENSFNSEDSGDDFEEYMTKQVYVFNPDRV